MPHRNAEVRMLDHGYVREARSLLYHAYRHDPTFAYLFESERPGFDQRVRATVRELVQQHFAEELPAIGLVIEERLVGIALIAPPIRRLDITESWGWRLRMLGLMAAQAQRMRSRVSDLSTLAQLQGSSRPPRLEFHAACAAGTGAPARCHARRQRRRRGCHRRLMRLRDQVRHDGAPPHGQRDPSRR